MSHTAVSPDPQEGRADLRTYLGVLWRRKWLLLLVVIAIPLGVYGVSTRAPEKYESSLQVQMQPQVVDSSLFKVDASPTDDESQTVEQLNASARLIKTRDVARRAARRLDPQPTSLGALLKQVSAVPDTSSGFITITARDGDPGRAAQIANAFARAARAYRKRQALDRIDATIALIEPSLESLAKGDKVGRRQLSEQLQRLRALRAAQGSNARIVEPAIPSSAPVSPRPIRNTALAVLIALLLAAGLAFLLERLDRQLRHPLELEQIGGAPLLSVIPSSAFSARVLDRGAAEAFQTLRAGLTYFNINRPLECVVVTSPGQGDGKTTVSTQLAIAAASSGKDVVLIDCDMRHPRVAALLGQAAGPGLGAVLIGEQTLDDVMIDVGVRGGRLRVLPAGPSPPNPSELISSERMRMLVAELSEASDLVVLDTPPVLVISDAIPLLKQASGVVVVGRLNKTTRDSVRRLCTVIATAGGAVLGVVATGAKRGGLYGLGGYEDYHYVSPVEEVQPVSQNGAARKRSRAAAGGRRRLLGRRS